MRLAILGYGKSGKDTAAEILREELGWTYESTSRYAAREFIYDALKEKYGYGSYLACYLDRRNKRALWHDLIAEYCEEDPARIIRNILDKHNVVVGPRNQIEFLTACSRQYVTYSIWIDASRRIMDESPTSCGVKPEHADEVLDNNGTEEAFRAVIRNWIIRKKLIA